MSCIYLQISSNLLYCFKKCCCLENNLIALLKDQKVPQNQLLTFMEFVYCLLKKMLFWNWISFNHHVSSDWDWLCQTHPTSTPFHLRIKTNPFLETLHSIKLPKNSQESRTSVITWLIHHHQNHLELTTNYIAPIKNINTRAKTLHITMFYKYENLQRAL